MADYEAETLIIYVIFSLQPITLDAVIVAMLTTSTTRVLLHFIPIELEGYSIEPFVELDSTLFIFEKDANAFVADTLGFPLLSRT